MGDLTTHKLRRAATVLALTAIFLAGCSAIKLGYETLPTWAFFQLDRYWKLDASQSELVRARLNEYQQWHRKTELPQYGRLLAGVREQVRGSVQPADVARWREAAEGRWHQLAQHAAPPLAEVALTLKPEQIERMKKRLAEQNAEYRKKVLANDPRERQEKRIERVEERAEFFLGRLNEAQREAVQQHAATLGANDDAFYAERLARQQAMVGTIERIAVDKPPREQAQRQLEGVLAQLWKPRDAQHAAAMERSAASTDQLTATLVNSATPVQKTRMAQRLQTWTGDFEILATR